MQGTTEDPSTRPSGSEFRESVREDNNSLEIVLQNLTGLLHLTKASQAKTAALADLKAGLTHNLPPQDNSTDWVHNYRCKVRDIKCDWKGQVTFLEAQAMNAPTQTGSLEVKGLNVTIHIILINSSLIRCHEQLVISHINTVPTKIYVERNNFSIRWWQRLFYFWRFCTCLSCRILTQAKYCSSTHYNTPCFLAPLVFRKISFLSRHKSRAK